MKILFFSILSFFFVFSLGQNQFPTTGSNQTAIIDGLHPYNGKLNLINGSVMNIFGNSHIIMDGISYIQMEEGTRLITRSISIPPHVGSNMSAVKISNGNILYEVLNNAQSGLLYTSQMPQKSEVAWPDPFSGIGYTHNYSLPEKSRLYMTHGINPSNSTVGINILPNGNTGIGTISPTTKLEITTASALDSNNYGDSGLRLTNLTSNNNPIAGAVPIGVDATGKVVRVEGGGSSRDAWLLTGNEETNPLVNFLGTTDNQPLVIRTNNAQTLRINTSGRLVFYNSDISINAANSNLYIAGGNDSPISGHTGIASNTVVGISSFRANTSGQFNTVFGNSLLYKNTTGSTNTVIGYNSMINSTTGSQNVVVGSNSMNAATTSTQNVVVGNNALTAATTTGNFNVAVGNGTLNKVTTGQYNIHLGYYNAEGSVTTGTRNIGIGYNAGKNITTGSNNIIIGSENLPNIILNAPISATESNQLNIGNWIYGHNGKIAIGSFTTPLSTIFTNNPDYQLIVKNGIKTEKVRVELASANSWPDYVFEKDYRLISLEELETFVSTHKHLPNVPKAEEIEKEGIDLGQMDAKLLEKIEELTLYNIDLYKESKSLKEENQLLQEENKQQQELLEELLKRVEQLESNK